jgi:KamA family protein
MPIIAGWASLNKDKGMRRKSRITPRKYRAYTRRDIDEIPQLRRLPRDEIIAMKAVSAVLPFRVNNYVLEELIRWERIPEDPLYQLTFPQKGMLGREDFLRMADLIQRDVPQREIDAAAREIQMSLNPHPAGQMELNVPRLDGDALPGMQHKYRETVLFFPSHGQTCHAYCTYCFRWPQFVGIDELKFASRETQRLVKYLRSHPEVHSVLFTGGDPLIMKTAVLRRYIEPLLAPDLEHLVSIRIGTKATAYWPHRFVTDGDADDLMKLFEEVRAAGRHLALMSHYSHPRELETPAAQAAARRIQDAGAVIRCQAPLIRRVNDDADIWADLWRLQVRLGAVPYYMFVERDTGPKNYFEVPLARAHEIFRTAYKRVSGLARTVRGPSMSATPGKVVVEGTAEVGGEKVFVLKFIQARDPDWVCRPFFARFDPKATWLDQLRPAFGDKRFFFEPALREIKETGRAQAWGQRIPRRRPLVIFGHAEWE